MPIDYSHSKIYKIVDNTNGNIYIGSTTQSLSQRLGHHTRQYKRYCNGKCGYMSSFDIIKNMSYEIILIEEVNCNNKEQLHKIEREFIEGNKCVNLNIPTRSQKEYIEYQKEYKEANIEAIKKYQKEYKKQYYDLNQDKIKNIKKKYYEDNKKKKQQEKESE